MAGPDPMSARLDTLGTGADGGGLRAVGEAVAGSAVTYDDGKISRPEEGRGSPTSSRGHRPQQSCARLRTVQLMGQPRKQHNLTLSPDGNGAGDRRQQRARQGRREQLRPAHRAVGSGPERSRFWPPRAATAAITSPRCCCPTARALDRWTGEWRRRAALLSPLSVQGASSDLSAAPPKVADGGRSRSARQTRRPSPGDVVEALQRDPCLQPEPAHQPPRLHRGRPADCR